MIEIDSTVIERCKQYLPMISNNAFSDPKTELIIADAATYLATTDRYFDVIIVDSTDPKGPSIPLFGPQFYSDCKKRLGSSGILITQCGTPFLQPNIIKTSYQHLCLLFRDTWFYTASVPTYIGGLLAIGWATDDTLLRHFSTETIQYRLQNTNIITNYYTPELHVAAFALPRYFHPLMK